MPRGAGVVGVGVLEGDRGVKRGVSGQPLRQP